MRKVTPNSEGSGAAKKKKPLSTDRKAAPSDSGSVNSGNTGDLAAPPPDEPGGAVDARQPKRPKPSRKARAGRPHRLSGVLLRIGFFLFSLALIPAAALLIAYYHYSQDLPPLDALQQYRPKTVSYVYADDGRTIGEFSVEHRLVVPISQLPKHVVNAFVAAEDTNFYSHPGLDFSGILRAFLENVRAGRIVQGGSTITQQVTRSFLLSNEKTYERKIREALLAFRIEKNLTKDEILFLYINQIYLGHGAYGIESAAQIYFGKHASELTLAESAMIAGLTKAPSRFSPLYAPKRAKIRQTYVLNRMMEAGFISLSEGVAALNTELQYKERIKVDPENETPYFTEHIRRTIEAMYGPDRLYWDGLRVYTTVNIGMQKEGLMALRTGLRQLTYRHGARYEQPIRKVPEPDIPGYLDNQLVPRVTPGFDDEMVITRVDAKERALDVQYGPYHGRIPYKELSWALRGRSMDDTFHVGDVILARALPLGKQSNENVAMRGEPEDPETDAGYAADMGLGEENPIPMSLDPVPWCQGALVCIENETGAVKAMIGGRDYWHSQFNRAVQARRQPGSSFKPFIYSAAIDTGFTQASVVNDIPVAYPDGDKIWIPKNYGGGYSGPVTLKQALTRSINVVAVRLSDMVGLQKVIEYAHKMGIKSPLAPNRSLALGAAEVTPLEMAAAFTTFPNLGERVEPMFITRIEDRDGRIITEFGPQRIRALSPETAYIVLDMMRNVVNAGTGIRVRALGRPVAGKTGTTNDLADAWFVGYTPEYSTAVWVGRDVRVSLGPGEQGGRTSAPIFLDFMSSVLKDKPVRDFHRPMGVISDGLYCFRVGETGPGTRSESMPDIVDPLALGGSGEGTGRGPSYQPPKGESPVKGLFRFQIRESSSGTDNMRAGAGGLSTQ